MEWWRAVLVLVAVFVGYPICVWGAPHLEKRIERKRGQR